MSEEQVKRLRWFSHENFSLIPYWRYRPANEHGASSFHIQWLCFQFWTNIAPELALQVGISDRHAFVMLTLPYSHLMASIPFPRYFHHKLWRKGTRGY